MNKKDRPLPSGRLSLRTALILRWLLPIICMIWSISYSKEVFYASLANCALTYIYDEMGYAAGHWAGRNIVNAMGFLSFEVGACLIASKLHIRSIYLFVCTEYFFFKVTTSTQSTAFHGGLAFAAQVSSRPRSRPRTSRIPLVTNLLAERLFRSSIPTSPVRHSCLLLRYGASVSVSYGN